MAEKIWVYIDHFRSQAVTAAWETLGAGLQLGSTTGGGVAAIIFGQGVEALAKQAASMGATSVLLADDPTLHDFRPEPYASLLSKLAGEHQPEVILFPTTTRGRELAAMAAVDLNTGVLPDVVAMEMVAGEVEAVRPIYAGKLLAKVKCLTRPQLITLRARSFSPPEVQPGKTASIVPLKVAVTEGEIATRVESVTQPESRVSLGDAAVVVSGGRGMANNPALQAPAGMDEKNAEIWRAKEGFRLLTELAEVLGGAVGASRAAVDAGYIPYAHQVGQTGKLISPDLYIACGISGAIQHLAGMRTSKVIVAINRDADAPIFKLARYGVVGDVHALLPALTEEFRRRLQK